MAVKKPRSRENRLIRCTYEEFISPPIRKDRRGGKPIDLTGEEIGGCKILGMIGYKEWSDGTKDTLWKLQCHCGDHFIAGHANLNIARRRKTLDCQGEKHLRVKPGDKIGRLTIQDLFRGDGTGWWANCSCSCGAYPDNQGNFKAIRIADLELPGVQYKKARTSSCGCFGRERSHEANVTHGASISKETNPKFHKIYRMIHLAKNRAKTHELDFNLKLDDFADCPDTCPVLGLEFNWTSKKLSDNSPTMDRIEPQIGYIPGNVVIISAKANRIKNDASLEDLETVTNWLRVHLRKEEVAKDEQ